MPLPGTFDDRRRLPGSADGPVKQSLTRQTVKGIVTFQGGLALLLMITAGSVHYWQGWLFWAIFGAAMVVVSFYFLRHDPHLVAIRLKVGPTAETRPEQKRIQTVAGILVFVSMALPGVDYRFGWSSVPLALVILGNLLVVLGFAGMFRVFQENTHAAATVRVEAAQQVISTGPYAIVRHPMYAAALAMFAGVPLALGSWWALAATVGLYGVLVARILDEERFLLLNLRGYREYCDKVRYRLIPRVW